MWREEEEVEISRSCGKNLDKLHSAQEKRNGIGPEVLLAQPFGQ
jgi:hypothetical protein